MPETHSTDTLSKDPHGKYDHEVIPHSPDEGFDATEPDSKSITGFVIGSVILLIVIVRLSTPMAHGELPFWMHVVMICFVEMVSAALAPRAQASTMGPKTAADALICLAASSCSDRRP